MADNYIDYHAFREGGGAAEERYKGSALRARLPDG